MDAIPLDPIAVIPHDPIFNALTTWPFKDEFVSRILINDIPIRAKFGLAQVWVYRDPQQNIVGFGTLDFCKECSQFTDGKPHGYIPLLAVHPEKLGRGHGKSILNHLVEEAACMVVRETELHHSVFLDVYESSTVAIRLYSRCGFVTLNGPILDPANGENFFVMAKRVSPE